MWLYMIIYLHVSYTFRLHLDHCKKALHLSDLNMYIIYTGIKYINTIIAKSKYTERQYCFAVFRLCDVYNQNIHFFNVAYILVGLKQLW